MDQRLTSVLQDASRLFLSFTTASNDAPKESTMTTWNDLPWTFLRLFLEFILSATSSLIRLASFLPPPVLVALVTYFTLTLLWRLLRGTVNQTLRLFKLVFRLSVIATLVYLVIWATSQT